LKDIKLGQNMSFFWIEVEDKEEEEEKGDEEEE